MLIASPLSARDDPVISLTKAQIELNNKPSIARGAKVFAQKCYACHSLKYLTHDKVSISAGITTENMPVWDETSWSGNPPPDLSLAARYLSKDWLYSFLHSYYQDVASSSGFNNLAWPNTRMPNPFASEQGIQVLVNPETIYLPQHQPFYRVIKPVQSGSISAKEFDRMTLDLVNYLVYVSDPSLAARKSMRIWVLAYLIIFAGFAFALYRHYWRTLKRKNL